MRSFHFLTCHNSITDKQEVKITLIGNESFTKMHNLRKEIISINQNRRVQGLSLIASFLKRERVSTKVSIKALIINHGIVR